MVSTLTTTVSISVPRVVSNAFLCLLLEFETG